MKPEAVLCASPQWTANSRQPFSFTRTSHAAGRSFAYPLRRCASLTKISFKLTGRRCFCPPSTQSADRRAVSISKEKRASPCPAFRKPPEPARRSRKSATKSAGVSDSFAPAICILPFHPAYPDLRRPKKQTAHHRLRPDGSENRSAAEWLAPHSGSFVSSKQPQYRHLAG